MMHWFIWKGKNSLRDFGLWIGKLPDIKRAPERYDTVDIPGRAGQLILLEGEDVYDSYERKCTVICRNTNPKLQEALAWLRGTSDWIVSNELNMVYRAMIINEIDFIRLGNDLISGEIRFYCEPLKKATHEDTITLSASGSVFNPGDVAAKPLMKVVKTGAAKIEVGQTSMEFYHLPGEVIIDCDAAIITTKAKTYDAAAYYYIGDYANYAGDVTWSAGLYRFTSEGIGQNTTWERIGDIIQDMEYIWPGKWDGEMLRIPPGSQTFTLTNSPALTIEPNWRWV